MAEWKNNKQFQPPPWERVRLGPGPKVETAAKKVKLTIDGRQIEVESGTTVLQAAERLGIEIPHFCWHPYLSIAGNCRMCLVKIEKIPKLQISCNTAATDGMVVFTDTQEVRDAVRGVLEFILINHPLDCPVCDQAGECGLQDYYMKFGLYKSRMADPKVKKGKVIPIGRGIMLDQERCILCSRCVRFMTEVARSEELAFFDRGSHVELNAFPGKKLQSPYSGNIVDICPVGALTSVDSRFRCRVWFLSETPSVCPGCAHGCNVYIHHAKYASSTPSADIYRRREEVVSQAIIPHLRQTVFRLIPRRNDEVNRVWMCDEGRAAYKHVNGHPPEAGRGRIFTPLIRQKEKLVRATWREAMELLTSGISGVLNSSGGKAAGGIGSPWVSNEENTALKGFFTDVLKSDRLAPWAGEPVAGQHDDFLMEEDKSPNRKGAETVLGPHGRLDVITGSKILIMFDQDPYGRWKIPPHVEEAAMKLDLFVVFGSNFTEVMKLAHIVLPIPAWVEQEGAFTNIKGITQRFERAFDPMGETLSVQEIFSRLSRRILPEGSKT